MTAEIICVGTEILMGNIVNTNAAYIAEKCAGLGITMYYQTVTGDNAQRLEQVVTDAMSRSDILIFSGGLGPTQDDLTKETVARAFGLSLVEDKAAMDALVTMMSRFGRTITENNYKQAMVPEGSKVLINENGTAPGIIIEGEKNRAILLPGPPNELIPMFHNQVMPYLAKLSDKVFVSRMIKLAGVGESMAETQILDLIDRQTNPTIATYAKTGECHIRVTASGPDAETAEVALKPVADEIESRFKGKVFSREEDESFEEVLVQNLVAHNCKLSVAESCTGGLIAARFINAPGASKVIDRSYVTYSEEAKISVLGVPADIIKTYGVVSAETAEAMALGCAGTAESDFALASTGVAGPDGGTEEIPVGTVYLACAYHGRVVSRRMHGNGNRAKVRESATANALTLLRDMMNEVFVCE